MGSASRYLLSRYLLSPTCCLSEHRRREGGMDGVLPLIGSKSKPSLSSPATAGQSEGRSDGAHLKARYLKVTAATADTREGISSLFIQVFPFFPSDFLSPALSLQSTLFLLLFTPSLPSCSFSPSDSADVSRVRRCDLNLAKASWENLRGKKHCVPSCALLIRRQLLSFLPFLFPSIRSSRHRWRTFALGSVGSCRNPGEVNSSHCL